MGTENTNNSSAPPVSLTNLVSSYPVLSTLASHITTIDLYNLARTSRLHFSYILASPPLFKALKRDCRCDGYGLAYYRDCIARSHERWATFYPDRPYDDSDSDKARSVYLDKTECDEQSCRPCTLCGISLCEPCRGYPADIDDERFVDGRPHLNRAYQCTNIMCLCEPCDTAMEKDVVLAFPNNHQLCDCDNRTRWVCRRCKKKESKFVRAYFKEHTVLEPDEDTPSTKTMVDHQFIRGFMCPCGACVDNSTVARCTWCRRRHPPEEEWWNGYTR